MRTEGNVGFHDILLISARFYSFERNPMQL